MDEGWGPGAFKENELELIRDPFGLRLVEDNKVKTVINGATRNMAFVHIEPYEDYAGVHLVVGAAWEDRCASAFEKHSLRELIDALEEVYEVLKESTDNE